MNPPSLYGRCLSALVGHDGHDVREIRSLPDTVLLDLYHTMFLENEPLLVRELSDLDVFLRVLKADHDRPRLLRHFQAAVGRSAGLPRGLSTAFSSSVRHVHDGIRLGGFLCDAGWYADAEIALSSCLERALRDALALECCHRLLCAQSLHRNFEGAARTYRLSLRLLASRLGEAGLEAYGLGRPGRVEPRPLGPRPPPRDADLDRLVLRLLKEFALFHFLKSDYGETYAWSMKALELLRPDTPPRTAVDALRIAGKACVMMRKFPNAEALMQQAVVRARTHYGPRHPKYAFTLLDYGFYFLNVDSILNSVTVYEEALGIFDQIYKGNNLHLAVAHEDLSYALYVHEYSSGRFYKALEHINRALQIMESLLPPEHLMLATTKRVKALILEEIALDNLGNQKALLQESESLHKSALSLSLNAFGEMNVQTAKHYGNLGRLYQSMRRFHEAESMQRRAIDIKKKILGDDDYEVGLSIGHLASLYNYHMNQFTQAEDLYYRSISISLKSFGEEYSGLEYDYIGLINVNTELKRPDRVEVYTSLLRRWREAREYAAEKQHPDFGQEVEMPIHKLQYVIFGGEHC